MLSFLYKDIEIMNIIHDKNIDNPNFEKLGCLLNKKNKDNKINSTTNTSKNN